MKIAADDFCLAEELVETLHSRVIGEAA